MDGGASAGDLNRPSFEEAGVFGDPNGAVLSDLLFYRPGELRDRLAHQDLSVASGEDIGDERLGLSHDKRVRIAGDPHLREPAGKLLLPSLQVERLGP